MLRLKSIVRAPFLRTFIYANGMYVSGIGVGLHYDSAARRPWLAAACVCAFLLGVDR